MPRELTLDEINHLDAPSFRLLYQAYYRALVFYSAQIIGDTEAAKDLAQELFSSLWERKVAFQSMPALRSYLYSAIRNASFNYLKHKDIEANYAEQLAGKHAGQQVDRNEEDMDEEEIYLLLFQTIDRLPERCRQVFLLYMEGRKNEEIAQALQVSLETVKTQKKRAMIFLRKNLGAYPFFILQTYFLF